MRQRKFPKSRNAFFVRRDVRRKSCPPSSGRRQPRVPPAAGNLLLLPRRKPRQPPPLQPPELSPDAACRRAPPPCAEAVLRRRALRLPQPWLQYPAALSAHPHLPEVVSSRPASLQQVATADRRCASPACCTRAEQRSLGQRRYLATMRWPAPIFAAPVAILARNLSICDICCYQFLFHRACVVLCSCCSLSLASCYYWPDAVLSLLFARCGVAAPLSHALSLAPAMMRLIFL
jgi:hypothetical protein